MAVSRPATIVSIGFNPVDNATLINAIFRSVVQQRGMAEGAKDPLSRQRAEKAAKLYDLTEAEQELLLAQKRGHALFMVGAKRLHINFEIPDYKMMYMGKAGDR